MKNNDCICECGKKIDFEGESKYVRCPNCGEKHYADLVLDDLRIEELSHYNKIIDKNINIDNAKAGNIVRFGDHYWRVLEVNDDKMLLLLNDCIKLSQEFEDKLSKDNSHYCLDDYNWENGFVREYLNTDYLQDEFDNESRNRILVNPKTKDKIFILSKEEIEKYLETEDDRKAYRMFFMDNIPPCEYLLRSKCDKTERPYIVDADGGIKRLDEGYIIEYFRPSIWVNKNTK